MTTLIIALGNRLRGDDAAGPALLSRLRERLGPDPAGIELLELNGDSSSLPACWNSGDSVYLLDASVAGAAPGTLRRIDGLREPLPALAATGSTHALGVAAGIELARSLGLLPAQLWIYAIEGADFTLGAGLSPAVATAVETAAGHLLAELGQEPAA